MRSSKSRSRSKTNRPRTLGNIINRVFDSSGPEGKVRGTPQQIIEKYQFLARDAQLSNDRVAAENFMQHAEHYTRMLGEAMREMAAEQEQRQPFQNQGQGGQNGQSGQNNQNNQNSQNGQNNQNGQRDRQNQERDYRNDRGDFRSERAEADVSSSPRLDVFEPQNEDDAGLVELPEAPRQQPRREEYRRDDRPREPRNFDRPRDDRPRDDRPRADKPRDDRARESQPRADKPRDDRPREAKPVVYVQIETVVAPQDVPAALPVRPEPVSVQEVQVAEPAKVTRAPRAPRKPAAEAKAKPVKPAIPTTTE